MAKALGLNVDQMRSLARTLDSASKKLAGSRTAITRSVSQAGWYGRDANSFRDRWSSVQSPTLERNSYALASLATDLRRQVDEQIIASSAENGGGSMEVGVRSVMPPMPGSSTLPGWFKPAIQYGDEGGKHGKSLGITIFDGSAWSKGFLGDHVDLSVGNIGAGLGITQTKHGTVIGVFGEVSALDVEAHGDIVGDKDLGVSLGGNVVVGQAGGFAGYQDGSFGAEGGVNLVSVSGSTGVNVDGINVGVEGEIGLKLELGFSIGKHTKIKLGPISFGFNIGGAK